VLIRGGPRHLLCALPGLTATAAAQRLATLDTELAGSPPPVAVSLGYAELEPPESSEHLIERANAAQRPR
jgi:hypothetical protein